ncbi:MAG: hypothetical protein PUC37_09305 [Spirochaetales bacterium]|nr:hypothetical protein [Spirochaetales bacterium]
MQKIVLSIFLIFCLFFISCVDYDKIVLSEDMLNKDIQFILSKNTELTGRIGNRSYHFSNLSKLCIQEKYWYALFNLDDNNKEQLLVVYNIELSNFDWCNFYPDTSYLFEDDLICFSIKIEPDKYPLSKSYKIITLIKDFKNLIEKSIEEKSRYDTSLIDDVQDFFYRKPRFLLDNNTEIKQNYLSSIDRKYIENDKIYYVLWEQAHYPISTYYYYYYRGKISSTCAYPPLDDSHLYRSVEEEFTRIKVENQNIDLIELKADERIISSAEYSGYNVYIIKTDDNTIDYANLTIRIVNGEKITDYALDHLFLYKDKFENIELAQGKDECACFIITTNVFSYDLYIDLISGKYDVYLRASSYPIEKRALE